MKKLTINIPEGLGDVLSQEELKHVLGGMGSNGSFSDGAFGSSSDANSPRVRACLHKNMHADCSYFDKKGNLIEGTCQLWIGRLSCSTLNRTPFRR